jgi:tRNA-Thr(GGU) m(6)t(6)A37 methyltransferase TsaA
MKEILFNPIGFINTPYPESKQIPIQGCFDKEIEGCCTLNKEFEDGLRDLNKFSHAILIYSFHKAEKTELISRPFLENEEHGIFAIRSPFRPNKIGFSIVKIKSIIDNQLFFTEVDMLDGTPLIDIKPFVKQFDNRENVKSGWVDKHFKDGSIPEQTILK